MRAKFSLSKKESINKERGKAIRSPVLIDIEIDIDMHINSKYRLESVLSV